MKLVVPLTLFLGITAALKSAGLQDRAGNIRKRISRPKEVAGVEMRASEYKTSTGTPTVQRSKTALTRVPGLQRRQEPKASDFFECTNPVRLLPPPQQ